MTRLSFEIDWVDAEGINGPELSATWASLRILAGDSVVTRVLDARAQTVRDFVYVPIYPLAEWLVTNWWFHTHELGSPAKEGDPEFSSPARSGYQPGRVCISQRGGGSLRDSDASCMGREATRHGRTSSS